MYCGARVVSCHLCMKRVIVETDHKNRLYMEQSEACTVIRWRIYWQSFNMMLRHIPGRTNVVADWGSRTYGLQLAEEEETVKASTWKGEITDGTVLKGECYSRGESLWIAVPVHAAAGNHVDQSVVPPYVFVGRRRRKRPRLLCGLARRF